MKDLYVLGVLGSPRLGGNSDLLLDKALAGAKSRGAKTEKIVLNRLKFCPCQEHENLDDSGRCRIKDDMQQVYDKIEQSNVFILAAPIFFGSLSAQTKMMIDRFQCLWRAKFMLKNKPRTQKKPGAFICVEASRRDDFFDNARSIVRNFFATIDVDYQEELFCPGIDEKGRILKHPDILQAAFELGQRLVSVESRE